MAKQTVTVVEDSIELVELDVGTVRVYGPASGLVFAAGESLGGHQAVALNPQGLAVRASADSPEHRFVEGLSTNSASTGEEVAVLRNGFLDHTGWTFTPELPVFLGLDGGLTQTVPEGALFSKVLGFALTPTRVKIDLQPAVFFN